MRMRIIPVLLLISLALLVAFLLLPGFVQVGLGSSVMDAPPPEAVIADLQEFIPSSMHAADVPGLSIALLQDGEIAWSAGFGEANTLTGELVTNDAVFEVASISKSIAAYAALRLVERGDLSLDVPVSHYLSQPWLPPSDYADQITLRHLLTHTSGLTNSVNPLDKSIVYPPGERYLYSGVGFIYLQEVLEQVTGQSLEQIAKEMVFEPLQMDSSSYVNSPQISPRLTYGHINYGIFLPQLIAVLAVAFVLTLLLVIVIQRIRLGKIALTGKVLSVAYVTATGITLAFVLNLVGWELNKWVTLAALWMVFFGLGMALLVSGGMKLANRLKGHWGEPQNRLLLLILWACIGGLALLLLTSRLSGPVPRSPAGSPNAAYSLRSTAPDLAQFLLELGSPRYLDPSLAAQMTAPQVPISSGGFWGFGVGIRQNSQGTLIWHGGDNADFHALMVIRPDRGDGVVILTNGQHGGALTREVASRALGVELDLQND